MKKYDEMSREELLALREELEARYEEAKGKGLKLDMSRGKPSRQQLDMEEELLTVIAKNEDCISENGTDCRNYGAPIGLSEARKLMGELIGVPAEQVIVCGNSSLTIMFDMVSRSYTHGVLGNTPWSKLDKVKFLCPVPGYDRHFGVTEYFGAEMINVPMTPEGPDMDLVEKLVAEDDSIKGIWCVPKYSNPQGISYSDETVRRFAALKPAAADFRIYWDNAYCVHHLYQEPEKQDQILNIIEECEKAGNPDMVYEFVSSSKISYAGGGISAVASSPANLAEIKRHMNFQTIGHDKINQIRHVKFFKNIDGIRTYMMKHAEILRPKFEAVVRVLDAELGGLGIGSWSMPRGGYFISFDAMPGCARAIVDLAKEAGVVMTEAGATYPYHRDPEDSNIRIAPSCPTPEELEAASAVFVLSVKLASVRKLLEKMG